MATHPNITRQDVAIGLYTCQQLVDRINTVIESRGGIKTCDLVFRTAGPVYRWWDIAKAAVLDVHSPRFVVRAHPLGLSWYYNTRNRGDIFKDDLDTAVIEFCKDVAQELYQ